MIITIEQLEIMFLMVAGAWAKPPLSSISGDYLGYSLSVTPERWTALRRATTAAEMASRALQS